MINFLYIMEIAIDINEELELITSSDWCGKFDFCTYRNISKLSARVANDYFNEAVVSTKNDIKVKIHIDKTKFDIKEYDALDAAITQLIGDHFHICYERWYKHRCSLTMGESEREDTRTD